MCEFRPLLCFCSQHMSRSKTFFLGLLCKFDIVTTTQRSENSSSSQGGGSVMASKSSSAANAQVASRSRNRTASNANCVNERCKILRSPNRVFVFEVVLCIGAPSKDPARFVDLGFWILRNKEAQEYKSSSRETNHNRSWRAHLPNSSWERLAHGKRGWGGFCSPGG